MQTNRRPETYSEKKTKMHARPVPNKLLVLWLTLLVVLVLVGAGLFVWQSKQGSTQAKQTTVPPVMTVTVEPAQVRMVHQEVRVTGSIWARDPLTLASEANGLQIQKVMVDEGDQVKMGQVLAVLNSAILSAELEREKALLAASQAALQKSFQPNRKEDINGLAAAVAQARASCARSGRS